MNRIRNWALLTSVLLVLLVWLLASCGGMKTQPRSPLDELRQQAPGSSDPQVVGRWLLSELISQEADVKRAQQARERLEKLGGQGVYASLARAIDAEVHGDQQAAARAYLALLREARVSDEPLAPVMGWYGTNRVLRLQNAAHSLWPDAKDFVLASLDDPGSLGWRARGELVEWWAQEKRGVVRKGLHDEIAKKHGCIVDMRLAGPFGRGVASDRYRSFEPEKPGRWPSHFSATQHRPNVIPRLLKTKRIGCEVFADEAVEKGVFYVETFFELDREHDVLLAVQGSRAVFVDDTLVLERDPRVWGTWPSFGALVRLKQGRHRLVARVEQSAASIRILRKDGTPLTTVTSTDASAPYMTQPPRKLDDPNLLNQYVRGGDVIRPKDDVETYLAAYLAYVDGQDDMGSVLMEPLVKRIEKAGPVALAQQAMLIANDPAFPEGTARDLARELHQMVIDKDPGIWRSQHWLIVDGAHKRGLAAAAHDLRELYEKYPSAEGVGRQLLDVYMQLGWMAEHSALTEELAKCFPNDVGALTEWMRVLESLGRREQADEVLKEILKLDPDSEIEFERALLRQDYERAIAELERLGKSHPDRKRITQRIASVMRRAGLTKESFDSLEQALKDNPRSASARLDLADARLAAGQYSSLRNAIADAIEAGADTTELENAIELLEGRTEFEPYRIDGRKIIEEYEKIKNKMDAAAVRVLDYGVTWVHRDGSSRLLEHEIIRVQSQEAISNLTEQRVPRGLLLRIRVLKSNGKVLEPEFVADKPTLTMPHLEIGDYIETEWITSLPGDGQGVTYLSPHWFFREQDIAYWRSEFVVLSPKGQPLTIETNGPVPEPSVQDIGSMELRRWRVDKSPAAVVEPGAVPIQEQLPNLRIGWGISLDRYLRNLVDSFEDQSIADPRLRGIARRIVKDVPKNQVEERARRIYRWVLANIEQGNERDGRRIVTGRSGDLGHCFLYLSRLVGIPTDIAIVKSALAQPSQGPISEVESFNNFVFRIKTKDAQTWLTVLDRFTPFGYLPSQVRGQQGHLLVEGAPAIVTGAGGTFDGVIYEGQGELRPTGSASLELSRSFVGKIAIGIRHSIEQIPEAQLPDVIENQLLSKDLPGASLVHMEIIDRDELDKPLILKMKTEVPDFARRSHGGLVITPPLSAELNALASLSSRQTTLLLGDASRIEVRLRIKLPKGAKVLTTLEPALFENGNRKVEVNDRIQGDELVIDRLIDLPAARIQPNAYKDFQRFTLAADEVIQREIRIQLP